MLRRRFQFTGSLLETSAYLGREADRVLLSALEEGAYCHVLAPRQVGKSSLRMRSGRALEAGGVRAVQLDLTSLGSSASPDEWYFGLADVIASRLKLPDPVGLWEDKKALAPPARFGAFLREVVLREVKTPLVIFIDEIEAVRLVQFPTDDFFAVIRALYEERSGDVELRRLTFCLLGVSVPNDLVHNKRITPFNISRGVRLADFARAELAPLEEELRPLGGDASAILDAVHGWTDGHPYMTMKLCHELAALGSVAAGREAAVVDEVVERVFLAQPLADPNLNYALRRFETDDYQRKGGVPLTEKIELYRRVLEEGEIEAVGERAVELELYLTGMIKQVEVGGAARVRVRNRICARVFDREWLRGKERLRFLSESMWQWIDSEKKEAFLLGGDVLGRALEWAKTAYVSDEERAFLEQSQAAEQARGEAEARRARRRILLTGALVLGLSGAGVLGAWGYGRALVAEASRELEEVSVALAVADGFLNAAKGAREELEQVNAELRARAEEALAAAEGAKGAAARAESEAVAQRERLEEAERDLAALRAREAEASRRVQVADAELGAVRRQISELRSVVGSRDPRELERILGRAQESERELTRLQTELARAEREHAALAERLAAHEVQARPAQVGADGAFGELVRRIEAASWLVSTLRHGMGLQAPNSGASPQEQECYRAAEREFRRVADDASRTLVLSAAAGMRGEKLTEVRGQVERVERQLEECQAIVKRAGACRPVAGARAP